MSPFPSKLSVCTTKDRKTDQTRRETKKTKRKSVLLPECPERERHTVFGVEVDWEDKARDVLEERIVRRPYRRIVDRGGGERRRSYADGDYGSLRRRNGDDYCDRRRRRSESSPDSYRYRSQVEGRGRWRAKRRRCRLGARPSTEARARRVTTGPPSMESSGSGRPQAEGQTAAFAPGE